MTSFPFSLPLLLDGANGTNLFDAGMPHGVCVEQWAAEHREITGALHQSFAQAGSDAVLAATFSANRIKLAHYGLQQQVSALNCNLVSIAREAVGPGVLVGGDLSPTGEFCEPFGDGNFLAHISAYAEQSLALRKAGADFILAETMMSLEEARAALLGAWQCRLPVFICLTIDEHGRTLSGADVLAAMISLQSLGVAAFGLNCSGGASMMEPHLRRIAPYARVPLIAKPNAGLPDPLTGAYDQTPAQMADEMRRLLQAGAQIIGGCCGTKPAHIAAMRQLLDDFDPATAPVSHDYDHIIVCNETSVFFLDEDFELSEPLACSLDMMDDLLEAEDKGCDVISILLTSPEDAHCFAQNAHMAKLPVSFLASNEEALEAGLICYNGRAVIDSRGSVPKEALEALAAGYGAVLR